MATLIAINATYVERLVNGGGHWVLDTAEARAECAKDAAETGHYFGAVRANAKTCSGWATMLSGDITVIDFFQDETSCRAYVAKFN